MFINIKRIYFYRMKDYYNLKILGHIYDGKEIILNLMEYIGQVN